MIFEWDEEKNQQNRKKHGIWFEEAQAVFEDDYAKVFLDKEHSNQEERFLIIGASSSKRTLIIIHCYRQNEQIVRIISARKASKKEREVYEERI